jgi:Sec-independent protein translocase protein TatA
MKEVGPAWQALAVSVGDERLGEAARQADRLVRLFKDAAEFFQREKLKDAADMSQAAAQAAVETAKAARAKDIEAVKRVGTGILNQCRSCHPIYRERLPDGTYRLRK